MNEDVLNRLKKAKLLSKEDKPLEFVSTGSYALNRVISGDYTKGVPIGRITQIRGPSSTAKTLFLTSILANAQERGFYTVLIDSENAFSAEFARILGLNPDLLVYSDDATLEDCFTSIEKIIAEIRENDPDTPIVIGYDSLAVSPLKCELEDDKYEDDNMIGARRAKFTGACLRKLNPKLKELNVALVIINQIRSKVGVLYGNPETNAAGGNSLEYYLAVDLKTSSNKTSNVLKEGDDVVGIVGRVQNKKNKVSLPFGECDFKVVFNKGLDAFHGIEDWLVRDGIIEKRGEGRGQRLAIPGEESGFQKGKLVEYIQDETNEKFNGVRKALGI